MTNTAPGGGPNPPQEDEGNSNYAAYVPHDLKYSADFEDSLMHALLDNSGHNNTPDGIRIIPEDSTEQSVNGVSVRAEGISAQSLPTISEDELPLNLTDPRRVFQSPIPGIKLTHPGGYLEGGPGLDPEMDTFPDDFLANNPAISTPAQLRRARQKEIEASLEALKERLRARRRAKERNEQLEREIKTLTDQHSMEVRIQSQMAEEQRRKKEARAKRRRDREGGR